MITLKIKQTTTDGRNKTWKITKKEDLLTFGTSRKAKLVSIDAKSEAYQSVLEFRDNQWHYISFAIDAENPDTVIDSKTRVQLPDSELSFEVIKKEDFVLDQLINTNQIGAVKKNLVLVSLNNRVLKTHMLDQKESFSFYSNGQMQKMNLSFGDNWQETQVDGFTIRSKQVAANDISDLQTADSKTIMDKESRKSAAITFGLTGFLIAISLILAKKPAAIEVPVTKAGSSNIIVRNEIKKKTPRPETKSQASMADNQASSAPAGGKASAMLKGAIGVRISQLLGKVSVAEARTANVLVTANGIKAGEAPSGRALAAVGKVEASGRNWNGESTGKGSGVSTAGVGGGQGTKGLGGGLGQGKTGSGGVGLIEEESEIIGGLDREIIAQYIKTQLGQILYCYERQLSASPDLYGKIAVKFTIAGTGMVETQSINDTTLKNKSVETCILGKIARWKFPEPKGGTKVVVTYPFLFKSTN